jgi:hypothetical protein
MAQSVEWVRDRGYYRRMDEKEKPQGKLDDSTVVWDDEDEEALAAIDEGIREIEAGKGIPADEVRRRLPNWPTSSIRRDR